MNSTFEQIQGIQQKQVDFFHLHIAEELDDMAALYKLLTIGNETFLDGLKETLEIATNPNYSESRTLWPTLIDHNIRHAVKLNQIYVEATTAIQAHVAKGLEKEMPAYSQQFIASVERLTQVFGQAVEASGNVAVSNLATSPQPSPQKPRKLAK